MKFIHTSDWHIGRQFHHVSLLDDQRFVLDQLIELLQREAVDALIIAGDLYDRWIPPASAVALLDEVLTRITVDLGLPVLIIPGNHDCAERLTFAAQLLKHTGLHILGDLTAITTPVTLHGGGCSVDFYAIPYHNPEQVRQYYPAFTGTTHAEAYAWLLAQIEAVRDPDRRSVLMSHALVAGEGVLSDSERPLTIGGVAAVAVDPLQPFDYVALGHLHAPQSRGEDHIRYSGSILPYSFSEERQSKGVTRVEITATGYQGACHLPLLPRRRLRTLEGAFATLLAADRGDPAVADYLLIRLTDRHTILDPVGQLREIYPNLLHLERLSLVASREPLVNLQRQRLERGEMALIREFFQQIQGEPLTPSQEVVVEKLLTELHQQPHEVSQ